MVKRLTRGQEGRAPGEGSDPALRTWRRVFILGACLAFALLTYVRVNDGSAELYVTDAYYYYAYLPSWFMDHDLDFANQYQHRPDLAPTIWMAPTRIGMPGNPYAMGMPLLLSPAFVLAQWICGGTGDGWEIRYQVPVYTLAFLYSLAGVLLTAQMFSRFFGERVTFEAAVLLALGTPWLAYIWFEPSYSHGVSSFTVALYLAALLRARETPTGINMLLVGATLGIACMARWQNLALGICACMLLGKAPFPRLLLIAPAAILAFFPQMVVWKQIYGEWITQPQGAGYMQWGRPQVLGLLFSTNHGVYTWTPILLLSTLGFALVQPALRTMAASVFAGIAVQVLINAQVSDWWGSGAFGMRRMVDYLPLFALGHAAFGERVAENKHLDRGIRVLCVILVLLNGILAVRYYTGNLPWDGEISLQKLWGETLTYPIDRLTSLLKNR